MKIYLYSKDVAKFKIPIPSLEVQNQIVKYCNYNDERIKQLESELIQNKELAKLFIGQDFDKIQDEDATNEEDTTNEDANNEY
jgi:restriction endonuclease S subunit